MLGAKKPLQDNVIGCKMFIFDMERVVQRDCNRLATTFIDGTPYCDLHVKRGLVAAGYLKPDQVTP